MSLIVKDIQVILGQSEIIKEISFEAKAGEVVALLGLNGAGKTTLIKTLTGLITPVRGEISVDGEKIEAISSKERAKKMAYVPQQMSTPFDYEVEDFVLMGVTPYLGVFETPKQKHLQKVIEALEQLKISHLRKKRLAYLSGGEKQLVYLARAMVQQAKVMILDEPTAYLDFKRQHSFLGNLKNFIKKSDRVAVLSLHDPNLALQYADILVVIHEKKVLNILKKERKTWGEDIEKTLKRLYEGEIEMLSSGEHTLVVYQQ